MKTCKSKLWIWIAVPVVLGMLSGWLSSLMAGGFDTFQKPAFTPNGDIWLAGELQGGKPGGVPCKDPCAFRGAACAEFGVELFVFRYAAVFSGIFMGAGFGCGGALDDFIVL